MDHDLKIWPEWFDAVHSGDKSFEVRWDDREFKVGDTLLLREWDPHEELFTGRFTKKLVVYIVGGGQFGIETGYCIMGLRT